VKLSEGKGTSAFGFCVANGVEIANGARGAPLRFKGSPTIASGMINLGVEQMG